MSHFIDITGEHCPMTFVKVKLALAKIGGGEELDVLLKEGEPLQNVPRSAEEQGFTVSGIEEKGNGNYLVRIRK
ncbi:MAG TPA: sulfurtransferase TusA family protein [Mariprofundaceae bacterium]|nr:sulfurtransferase TusA family protein [Mariprofundaceae bacterium]